MLTTFRDAGFILHGHREYNIVSEKFHLIHNYRRNGSPIIYDGEEWYVMNTGKLYQFLCRNSILYDYFQVFDPHSDINLIDIDKRVYYPRETHISDDSVTGSLIHSQKRRTL